MITSALIISASSGLKELSKKMVSDAYEKLKKGILNKNPKIDFKKFEENPGKKQNQEIIFNSIKRTRLFTDDEILNDSKNLLNLILQENSQDNIKILIDNIHAKNINISDIKSYLNNTSIGIRVSDAKADESINIRDIKLQNDSVNNKKKRK
jgi:hypothetical protein